MYKLISGPASATDVYNYALRVALGYNDIVVKSSYKQSSICFVMPTEMYSKFKDINKRGLDKYTYIKSIAGMCGVIGTAGNIIKDKVFDSIDLGQYSLRDVIRLNLCGIIFDAYNNLNGNADLLTKNFPTDPEATHNKMKFNAINIAGQVYYYTSTSDTIYLTRSRVGLDIVLSKLAHGKKIMYFP